MIAERSTVAVAPAGEGTHAVLVEAAIPPVGSDRVRVRVEASGLCGTQIHQLTGARSHPTLLGHEAVGVVEQVGADVGRVAVGDRVVLSWIAATDTDGVGGAEVVLDDGQTAGTGTVYTFARHVVVHQTYVSPVPAAHRELPAEQLAVVGCALLTGGGAVLRDGRLTTGETAAVIGLGGIGLAAVAAAAASGAEQVLAVDLDHRKLDLARRLGATDLIDASTADPVLWARERRFEPTLVVDAAGTAGTTRTAVDLTRRGRAGVRAGGRTVLVGGRGFPLPIDAEELVTGGLSLIGCLGGSADVDVDAGRYLELLAGDTSPLATMVTDVGDLDELPRLLDRLRCGEVLGRAVVRCA